MDELAFPYYEDLLSEFEGEHNREPNAEERCDLWRRAEEAALDRAIAAAEARNDDC